MSLILKSNKNGTLLLEVLVTISILSIGLTLIIRSYVASFRAAAYTIEYSTAIILLENKLNDLLQNGFIESSLDERENYPEPYEKYQYHLQTKRIGTEEEQALNEVDLSILWSKGKKNHRIFLTTYLFEITQ